MEPVLIGSKAVVCRTDTPWVRDYFDRESDTDYLITSDMCPPQGDVVVADGIFQEYTFDQPVASVDEVYTLKLSHAGWWSDRESWYKNLRDITVLQKAGAVKIPQLYDAAYRCWDEISPKNVDLDKKAQDFFTESVTRFFDHDWLHETIAVDERPCFEKFLKTGEDVLPSRDKFHQLDYLTQLTAVWEEAAVLSLERDILPRSKPPSTKDVRASFSYQLEKLATTYSKGWFSEFIIVHFSDCKKNPLIKSSVSTVLDRLGSGDVKHGSAWSQRHQTWWGRNL